MSTSTDAATPSESLEDSSAVALVTLEIEIGGASLAKSTVSRPKGASAVEVIDDSPFAFGFTGRHDRGMMPEISSTSHYALLLEAVAEAKAIADTALTLDLAAAAKKPRLQGE